ncbi:hypothetical protein PS673_02039 [Pseudomonas fluorescens]|uniref:Uncharacterized protein n=1 Tax=Pseudomonas fluorescens TaxID=294 RepID=A0A5E6S6F6_PSEFL|nr:hypothetical protein PS673_02039 [Pseudomonas fluorescens]
MRCRAVHSLPLFQIFMVTTFGFDDFAGVLNSTYWS